MERKSSISDFYRIITEIIHKEKLKGVVSIGNIFSRILRKYKKFQRLAERHRQQQNEEQQKQIEEEIEDIKDEIYIHLSDEVLNQYPDGFTSLLPDAEKQEENQVYVVLELEGPKGFYNRFYSKENKKEEEKESHFQQENDDEIQLEYLTDNSFISKKSIQFKHLLEEILDRKRQTIEYIKLLNAVYLDTDQFEKILLEKVITQYSEIKSNEFIMKEPNKFNLIRQNPSKFILPNEQEIDYKFVSNLYAQFIFFEFKYEDFLFLFLKLTKFITGLSAKVEIDESDNVYVKLYCTDDNIHHLAEIYKIRLQSKPYAYYYEQLALRIEFNPHTTSEDDITLLLAADSKNLTQQFYQMNQNDQLLFPPFETFSLNKIMKFRRFTLNNDNFHNCPNDPELSALAKMDYDKKKENDDYESYDESKLQKCCSVFRGIDKLRLIIYTFEDRRLLYLKKFGRLKRIILLRNFKGYEIDNNKLIWSQINICNNKKQLYLIQSIRNFYGEKYGFYFLFKWYFLLWLIFPMILGFMFYNTMMFRDHIQLEKRIIAKFIIKYKDLIYFSYCFMIVMWGILFMKFWRQKEKLYSYFWGTEGAFSREKYRDEFVADGEENIMLEFKAPYQSQFKKTLKILTSYFITVLIMLLGFLIIAILFEWEKGKLDTFKILKNNQRAYNYFYPIMTSLLNSIQMELFNYIYSHYFAVYMTNWENHEKSSLYENSLILKEVIYKTINSFSSSFYIAFIKDPSQCENYDCFSEIGIQIYMNFFVFFVVRLLTYFYRIGLFWYFKNEIEKDFKKKVDFSSHSIYKLKALEDIDYILVTYNDLLIIFGKVIFFSVAAPLSPIIAFIVLFILKFLDNHSLFHYANTSRINEVKGIQIYYKIFYLYCFIGMIWSICLVLFTNPTFHNTSLIEKLITIALFENLVLLIIYLLNYSYTPRWFDNLDTIKAIYYSKYFSKDTETLPHQDLNAKISNKIMMSSIANHIKDDIYLQTNKIKITKDENKQKIDDKDISTITIVPSLDKNKNS